MAVVFNGSHFNHESYFYEEQNMDKLKNRIKGALIGIAYGDAFGMPSEMWTPEMIKERFGKIEDFLSGHPENQISAKLVRGEVTDDTINSLLVLDMLCENQGKVNAHLFIDKLTEWIASANKSSTVVGPSTAKAIELIKSGVPMEQTGKGGTTNGGAMKILPIGLIAGMKEELNLQELVDEVVEMCKPTHYTNLAISAACAIAAGGAAAVHGETDVEKIFSYMKEAADLGSKYGFVWGGPSVSKRMDMGRYFVDHNTEEEALQNLYDYLGTGLPSTESIPAAAVLVYMANGDPLKCARYAANVGGDTDTMGAMACGICGAIMGADVFPAEEVALLERVNDINFEELAEKATGMKQFLQ